MIYLGENNNQIEIYENDQLIFKACLQYKGLSYFHWKRNSVFLSQINMKN